MKHLVITHDPRVPCDLPAATRTALLELPAAAVPARDEGVACEATIVVVTEHAPAQARLCLESILAHTTGSNYELLVMKAEAGGFVAAANRGLALARSQVMVLISEDCVVAPGWLPRLMAHLEDRTIGVIGPVTNRASNEAQVAAAYSTFGEFVEFAERRGPAEVIDIRTVNGFCVAMRRDVYEHVGALDEQLSINVFQDEDYAVRVRNAGYRVVCAPDVFVHNGGRSAVGHLTNAGIHREAFQEVRRCFEAKWATPWYAYDQFNASQYDLLRRIRAIVLQAIPQEATVLIVSKGDEELLALTPRAWHFPRQDDGTYGGHHPADSAEAIAHLEQQRLLGADFLLIPNSASWWLTYYDGWRQHLEARYHAIVQDERTCVVFDLRGARS